jgi:hypothetical protein
MQTYANELEHEAARLESVLVQSGLGTVAGPS